MRRLIGLTLGLVVLVATAACTRSAPGSLAAASEMLGTSQIQSIQYSGSGAWFQFGQAPNAPMPWPQWDVSRFTATINYETPAARVEMARIQTPDPNRVRPAAQQQPVQLVSGTHAWNLAAPAGSPPNTPPAPQAQPAAVEERLMEIWSTPHGFLKAAAANNATSQPIEGGGSDVSFTVDGKHRYVGRVNAQNQLVRVQTWIDNPVLGDTPVDIAYSDYRDFGGVMFPAHIVRTQGGHTLLDLLVSEVTANPQLDATVPEAVSSFSAPAVTVDVEQLASGVYYVKGGTHHSVAIDQADHIVVVEGPQNEARSLAVIAKVKETIPNKPIRYLINTHVHFDHSGGLRTYVDEGATIVTHQLNRPYYEQAWSAPRTLNPDRLARSNKTATFETFRGMHTLTDGQRSIELYEINGSGHNDGFTMVYLPAEKILIEADAYTPAAANAPPPAVPNPFNVNLYDNIVQRNLDVRQIAALHGPRAVTMADLRAAIGRPVGTN
jgi:glyoxylase-like metal-dependent hydrolase (beta-lactamase superfamily II)